MKTFINPALSFYGNADSVVHIGPCILFSVVATGDGGATSCQLRDGITVKNDVIVKIAVADGLTTPVPFSYGRLCQNGLYLDVADGNCYVTVVFAPVELHPDRT